MKKKYSESERMYFVQAYNDSGLSLNEFCIMNKIDLYELKRWLKDYYLTSTSSNYDAGSVLLSPSLKATPEKKNIKINNTNGMLCFTAVAPSIKKQSSSLIENTKNTKNTKNQAEDSSLKDRISFRDSINECCGKLLDLPYGRSNIDLIEKLMEVLN